MSETEKSACWLRDIPKTGLFPGGRGEGDFKNILSVGFRISGTVYDRSIRYCVWIKIQG